MTGFVFRLRIPNFRIRMFRRFDIHSLNVFDLLMFQNSKVWISIHRISDVPEVEISEYRNCGLLNSRSAILRTLIFELPIHSLVFSVFRNYEL